MDPENFTYPVLGEALGRESQKLFNDYVEEVHRAENTIDSAALQSKFEQYSSASL